MVCCVWANRCATMTRTMSSAAIILVGLTALAAAGVQAATGLGFALVLTPVLFAVLSPTAAIITVTALGLELNLLAERRRPVVAWGEVLPILAAAVPGTVCGVLILRALPKPVLQIAVGILVIAAALLRVRRRQPATTQGGTVRRLVLGLATGALTTSSGVSGPPLALWFSHRGLRPAELRDSLSASFLAIGVIGGLALLPVLGGARLSGSLLAVGLACVVGGHAIGRRAFAALDARGFEPLLLAVVLIAGLASVVAGAASV
jgi:uncharacterized membrane protein YfcA